MLLVSEAGAAMGKKKKRNTFERSNNAMWFAFYRPAGLLLAIAADGWAAAVSTSLSVDRISCSSLCELIRHKKEEEEEYYTSAIHSLMLFQISAEVTGFSFNIPSCSTQICILVIRLC
jgi:hypothetical protein